LLSAGYGSWGHRYWNEALLLYDRQRNYRNNSEADFAPPDQSLPLLNVIIFFHLTFPVRSRGLNPLELLKPSEFLDIIEINIYEYGPGQNHKNGASKGFFIFGHEAHMDKSFHLL